ncbi:MAG: hypothetical protein AAGD86_13720, partial [Pseudomonadota bacterium]
MIDGLFRNRTGIALLGLGVTIVLLMAFKPPVNSDFHDQYLEALNELRTLPEQLAHDLAMAQLDRVLHYDFIEADLQRLEKTNRMLRHSPGFVDADFAQQRDALLSSHAGKLQALREQVDLAKRSIGLRRNAQQATQLAIERIRAAHAGDPAVLAALLQLTNAVHDTSAANVDARVIDLAAFGLVTRQMIDNLRLHAGALTRFQQELTGAAERFNTLSNEMSEAGVLLDLYRAQRATAV